MRMTRSHFLYIGLVAIVGILTKLPSLMIWCNEEYSLLEVVLLGVSSISKPKYEKNCSLIHSWAFAPTYSMKSKNQSPVIPVDLLINVLKSVSFKSSHPWKLMKKMKVIITSYPCSVVFVSLTGLPLSDFLWFEVLCWTMAARKKGRNQDKITIIIVISHQVKFTYVNVDQSVLEWTKMCRKTKAKNIRLIYTTESSTPTPTWNPYTQIQSTVLSFAQVYCIYGKCSKKKPIYPANERWRRTRTCHRVV